MTEIRKLADNVLQFMRRASDDYGRVNAEHFSQDMFCQLVEGEIRSPIEDMFFIAMHVQCAAGYVPVNPDPIFDNRTSEWVGGYGVYIKPQAKIGKYRVDFLISYTDGPQPNQVVVELDGHDFHDKNKVQRAYEKARDRYLVASGYRVLHFTGSEVFADPYKVARESMDILGATSHLDEYSPSNPVGLVE